MHRQIILAAVVLALTGCTTVKTINLGELSHTLGHTITLTDGQQLDMQALSEINRLAQRKKAHLTLVDGRTMEVSSLQVTPDSTSWMYVNTGRFETAATAEIQEIRFVRRGKGAGAGFGIGFFSGLVFGVVTVASDPGCPPEAFLCLPGPGPADVMQAGIMSGLVGALVGAAMGGKDIYRFNVSASPPQGAADEARQE